MLLRRTLLTAEEGKSNERPGRGRFHITGDNRLFVFFYVNGSDVSGQAVSENRLQEILPDGVLGRAVRVGLKEPFTSFFTATVRAGTAPSNTLELLGTRAGSGTTISYARIELD